MRMSHLAKMINRLESLRVETKQLEQAIATELNLPGVKRTYTKRLGPIMQARLNSAKEEDEEPKLGPGGKRFRSDITPEMITEMQRRVAGGEMKKKVADEMGVAKSTVLRHTRGAKPRAKKNVFNDELLQRVAKRLRQGGTKKQMIADLNIPMSMFFRCQRALLDGTPAPKATAPTKREGTPPKQTPAHREIVAKMMAENRSLREMAKATGLGKTTVHTIRKQLRLAPAK